MNIFVATTKRDTWFRFSFVSIKDALMMVVDSTLIAYCVIVIIIAMVMGYQHCQYRIPQKFVVESRYPFKSDQELNKIKRKFGVHALEIVNNEWGCYVDGKWWCAFPEDRPKTTN